MNRNNLFSWLLLFGALWVTLHLSSSILLFSSEPHPHQYQLEHQLGHQQQGRQSWKLPLLVSGRQPQQHRGLHALDPQDQDIHSNIQSLLSGGHQSIPSGNKKEQHHAVHQRQSDQQQEKKKDDRRAKVFAKMAKRQKRQDDSEQAEWQEGHALSSTFDFTARNFSHLPMPLATTATALLPDMTTDRGGVIFFLHLPKTGGQTIRHNFGLQTRSAKHKLLAEMQPDVRAQLMNMNHHSPHFSNNSTTNNTNMQSTAAASNATASLSRVSFVWANYLDVFLNKAVPKVNKYLSHNYTSTIDAAGNNTSSNKKSGNNDGKILFVEVHGMDNYNMIELEPYIHAWRKRSKETGVPFFAFTLLREPIAEQVSFFNFYHLHPGDTRFCGNHTITTSTRCGKQKQKQNQQQQHHQHQQKQQLDDMGLDRAASTKERNSKEREANTNYHKANEGIDLEDAMVKSVYNNSQCLFLARGERTFGDNNQHLRQDLDKAECQSTYDSLRRTMDWIGRTETLSNETLPLLTKIMFGNPDIGRNLPKSNTSPKTDAFVHLSNLQPKTRMALEAMSGLDQEMYRKVQDDYTMDQWSNW